MAMRNDHIEAEEIRFAELLPRAMVQTVGAAFSIAADAPSVIVLKATTGSTVTVVNPGKNKMYFIKNASATAVALTINDDAGSPALIASAAQNESAIIAYLEGAWYNFGVGIN